MLIPGNKATQIFIPLLKILAAILSVGFILNNIFKQTESFAILFHLVFEHSTFVLFCILACCFALTTCNWTLEILKWQTLSSELQPTNFKKATTQTLSAHAIAILTPNRIGDYGAKMLFFPKNQRKRVLMLNVWNNLSQMAITLLFGCIGLFFVLKQFDLAHIFKLHHPLLGILLISICVFLYLIKGSLKKTWRRFQCKLNTALKMKLFALSLVRYLVFSHQFILLGWFLGWDLAYFTALPLLFVMYFLASLMPSIFILDAAVKAGIAIYLFGQFDVASSIVLAITASMWALNFALPAFIGNTFIWPGTSNTKKKRLKIKLN